MESKYKKKNVGRTKKYKRTKRVKSAPLKELSSRVFIPLNKAQSLKLKTERKEKKKKKRLSSKVFTRNPKTKGQIGRDFKKWLNNRKIIKTKRQKPFSKISTTNTKRKNKTRKCLNQSLSKRKVRTKKEKNSTSSKRLFHINEKNNRNEMQQNLIQCLKMQKKITKFEKTVRKIVKEREDLRKLNHDKMIQIHKKYDYKPQLNNNIKI